MNSTPVNRRPLQLALAAGGVLVAAASLSTVLPIRAKAPGPANVTVDVRPRFAVAGGWTPLRFTIKLGHRGLRNGIVTLSVPAGWARPSISAARAGSVRASDGTVTVKGRQITARGVDLRPDGALTVTYGGGPGGATEPSAAQRYEFAVKVAGGASEPRAVRKQTPSIEVKAPMYRCNASLDPAGMGRRLMVPDGIARPNLHNTRSSAGVIQQCYGAAGLTTEIALTRLSAPAQGPAGFPEVAYGYHLYDQPFCATCHSRPFPLRVSALGGVSGERLTTAYSLGASSPRLLPRDFIYDLWLEQDPAPGTAPRPGDIELIIFLYREGQIATCLRSPLPVSFAAPASINARRVSSRWRVCQIYGGTQATPVAFFLEFPQQAPTADISLPLGRFIAEAARYVGRKLDGYSLMGIELGGEFDQCSPARCVAASVAWEWRVSRLMIEGRSGSIPVVFPIGG